MQIAWLSRTPEGGFECGESEGDVCSHLFDISSLIPLQIWNTIIEGTIASEWEDNEIGEVGYESMAYDHSPFTAQWPLGTRRWSAARYDGLITVLDEYCGSLQEPRAESLGTKKRKTTDDGQFVVSGEVREVNILIVWIEIELSESNGETSSTAHIATKKTEWVEVEHWALRGGGAIDSIWYCSRDKLESLDWKNLAGLTRVKTTDGRKWVKEEQKEEEEMIEVLIVILSSLFQQDEWKYEGRWERRQDGGRGEGGKVSHSQDTVDVVTVVLSLQGKWATLGYELCSKETKNAIWNQSSNPANANCGWS